MARIRSVHPGLWTDEEFVSVSLAARLLFIGMLNESDDGGAFEWKALTLKMRLFPVDVVDISALLSELAAVGKIAAYTVNGKQYGAIRNFGKFQRPKKPHRVHPMPDEWRVFAATKELGSENEERKDNPSSEKVENQFPTSGETSPQMEEEEVVGGEGSKEEPASQGAAAPDAPPVQTSFLPPVPMPPPTPLDVLYAAGLPILVKLTGKSADHIRPHLGGLAKIAGPEIVLATLQDCENAPPKGSVYAWVRKCCEAEAKRHGVRLVVDNDPADHWGIEAWCRSLPGVLPTETEEHRKAGKWLYSGAIVDGLARRIAEIAQLPPTWRGDWTLLGEWLAAGHEIDAILGIITEIAGRVDCVSSLRLFDERVRRLPCPNLKFLQRNVA